MEKKESLLKRFWNYHDWHPAYLGPIILGLPGALVSYFILRKKNPKIAKKSFMLFIIFLPFIGGPLAYYSYRKDDPVYAKKYLTLGLVLSTMYVGGPGLFVLVMSSSDDFDFLPSQIEIRTWKASTCNTDIGTFSNGISNGPPVFENKWNSFTIDERYTASQDVAVDSESNVYVTVSGYKDTIYRVYKFSPDGNLVSEWSSPEIPKYGAIARQTNIAIDNDDNVYVTDRENFRIQKFSNDGQFLTEWNTIKAYGIDGLAIDSDNSVYGLENSYYFSDVRKWSSNGEMISKWHLKNYDEVIITNPSDIAIDIFDQIYVLEGDKIHKLDCKGNYQTTTFLAIPSSFSSVPQRIHVDSLGYIYITSFYAEHEILKFTNDGEFVTKWNLKPSDDGKLGSAGNIGMDSSGNLFVVDSKNGQIQKFI